MIILHLYPPFLLDKLSANNWIEELKQVLIAFESSDIYVWLLIIAPLLAVSWIEHKKEIEEEEEEEDDDDDDDDDDKEDDEEEETSICH